MHGELSSQESNVVIALATWNGERYLEEFLASVRDQSSTDWLLLVRDDGSTDATPVILDEAESADSRIVVLRDGGGRLGVTENFAALLQAACDRGADYVFLADQDDVWQAGKVLKQMDAMQDTEKRVPANTPVLVYSDLTVTDEHLRVTGESFMRDALSSFDERSLLRTLLAHNVIPGCAMLLNRELLRFSLPMPAPAPVHDWWIALCAAVAGECVAIPDRTILYRQHGANAIGAIDCRDTFSSVKRLPIGSFRRWLSVFADHVEQTNELRHRLHERSPKHANDATRLLDDFCDACGERLSFLRRISRIRKLGLPQTEFTRRLAFWIRLMLLDLVRSGHRSPDRESM